MNISTLSPKTFGEVDGRCNHGIRSIQFLTFLALLRRSLMKNLWRCQGSPSQKGHQQNWQVSMITSTIHLTIILVHCLGWCHTMTLELYHGNFAPGATPGTLKTPHPQEVAGLTIRDQETETMIVEKPEKKGHELNHIVCSILVFVVPFFSSCLAPSPCFFF